MIILEITVTVAVIVLEQSCDALALSDELRASAKVRPRCKWWEQQIKPQNAVGQLAIEIQYVSHTAHRGAQSSYGDRSDLMIKRAGFCHFCVATNDATDNVYLLIC